MAAGHSLGEYAALVASGAVELEPGLEALATRAEAMGRASRDNPGAMTALIGVSPEDAARSARSPAAATCWRSRTRTARSRRSSRGRSAPIERAEELARGRGAKAIRLSVAGAFHSPLMEPALAPVREVLSRIEFHAPSFPIVPNVSATPTTQPSALRDCLSRHLVSPGSLGRHDARDGGRGHHLVPRGGPGDVLAKLARRAVPGAVVHAVGSPDEARAVADEVRREQDDF